MPGSLVLNSQMEEHFTDLFCRTKLFPKVGGRCAVWMGLRLLEQQREKPPEAIRKDKQFGDCGLIPTTRLAREITTEARLPLRVWESCASSCIGWKER